MGLKPIPERNPLGSFFLRDAALLAFTLWLWNVAARPQAEPTWLTTSAGIAAGSMVTICGFLAHEWGHLAGALAARSVVHFPPRLASVFLFHFDSAQNDRFQFLSMSMGGFAASILVIAAFLALVPFDTIAGRVAIVLLGLGVLATLVLEVPTAWRVAKGAPLPRGAVYSPPGAS
jgi:hypothetical protein